MYASAMLQATGDAKQSLSWLSPQAQTPQESPRDAENAHKGLLPKMKSINWNQDLSGTAISQHETFDETDSSDTDNRGQHQCVPPLLV